MPMLPTIWAARVVAYLRSPATPELRSPKKSCSATSPPREIWTSDSQLRLGLGEALLGVGVGQQPEGRAALDDREHLQLAGTCRPARPRWRGPTSWVAMVRRSASVYSTGWARPISSVILACWTSSHDIAARAPPQRPHQGLVEQVDQHGRAVAERLGRQPVGPLGHLRLVGTTGQLVVQDLLPPGPARQIEGDGAVEPARPQQGRVQIGRPVGRPDDQHVGRRDVRLVQGPVGRQEPVDDLDDPAPPPRPARAADRRTAAGSAAR